MKREFLEEMGLEKEQIDKILDANSADVGKARIDYDNIKSELDTTKQQLADANTAIEGFGDYEEIKGQVADYKQKYEASEAEKVQIKQDYEFNGKLESAAKKHGARALKAVLPFLKTDDLKASKNQDTDIENAFKELKENEESKFLFADDEPIKNPVLGGGAEKPGAFDAVAAAMGLTEKDFK